MSVKDPVLHPVNHKLLPINDQFEVCLMITVAVLVITTVLLGMLMGLLGMLMGLLWLRIVLILDPMPLLRQLNPI